MDRIKGARFIVLYMALGLGVLGLVTWLFSWPWFILLIFLPFWAGFLYWVFTD